MCQLLNMTQKSNKEMGKLTLTLAFFEETRLVTPYFEKMTRSQICKIINVQPLFA
jgi:hypothetical protein